MAMEPRKGEKMKIIIASILILSFLTGCEMFGAINQMSSHCSIKNVEGVKCVLCNAGKDSISVDCQWK